MIRHIVATLLLTYFFYEFLRQFACATRFQSAIAKHATRCDVEVIPRTIFSVLICPQPVVLADAIPRVTEVRVVVTRLAGLPVIVAASAAAAGPKRALRVFSAQRLVLLVSSAIEPEVLLIQQQLIVPSRIGGARLTPAANTASVQGVGAKLSATAWVTVVPDA